jgi:putative heme iron utilization protein
MSENPTPAATGLPGEDKREVAFQARLLLRASASGVLATQADGQPFASLATPATAPDLSILLWLSTLSEHTRHLAREPRCALMVSGAAEGPNPQMAPRLTITGIAEQIGDEGLKARWLARHPYAALYAGFADFGLWRIAVGGAAWVGGFARARKFRMEDFLPDPEAVAAIAAAEAEIVHHVNEDHADAVLAIARHLGGGDGPWRLTAVDTDGCDMALEERVIRLPFARPAATPDDVRRELILAARAARAG